MRVIEQFVQGKAGDSALCEDLIAVTPDFIVLLDGATTRTGGMVAGMTPGRFAAETVAQGIKDMPADITAQEAVIRLTHYLRARAAAEMGGDVPDGFSRPAAALLLYSRARREIWRVADSTFLIDGAAHYKTFPQEAAWSAMRQTVIHAKLARGMTEQQIADNDTTWDTLTPIITECRIFANSTGVYGYGVFNGDDIPEQHIEVYPVKDASEIVFASDGYPEVFTTLDETEKQLAAVLAQDPLMYKIHPQVKGVKKGHLSYDDRSYIRFNPD